MAIVKVKASFKNSRISPRAATTSATTTTDVVDGTPKKVLDADSTRTYATMRNTSLTVNVRYDYTNDPDILTDGMILKAGEAVDLESPTELWVVSEGAPVTLAFDIGRG